MAMLRTTILIDDILAARVRQMFDGNLTRGVNTLLQAHIEEKKPKLEGFGMFKGEGLLDELIKTRRDERRRGAR